MKEDNAWKNIEELIDFNLVGTKDISRMKSCLISKINDDKT